MDDQIIIVVCAFSGAVLLTLFVFQLLMSRGEGGKLRNRLSGKSDARRAAQVRPGLRNVLQQIGQAAAKPFMPKNTEKQIVIRRNLAKAGIYTPSGIRLVTGAKVICLGIGVVVGWVVGTSLDQLMFGLSLGGLGGYLVPMMWLRSRTGRNQRELTNGLADALDLMMV